MDRFDIPAAGKLRAQFAAAVKNHLSAAFSVKQETPFVPAASPLPLARGEAVIGHRKVYKVTTPEEDAAHLAGSTWEDAFAEAGFSYEHSFALRSLADTAHGLQAAVALLRAGGSPFHSTQGHKPVSAMVEDAVAAFAGRESRNGPSSQYVPGRGIVQLEPTVPADVARYVDAPFGAPPQAEARGGSGGHGGGAAAHPLALPSIMALLRGAYAWSKRGALLRLRYAGRYQARREAAAARAAHASGNSDGHGVADGGGAASASSDGGAGARASGGAAGGSGCGGANWAGEGPCYDDDSDDGEY
jgi:hypothetical protein